MERAVLTLATDQPLYVEMAATLARSFRVWHGGSDVRFVLATDRPDLVPDDLTYVDVVAFDPGGYGRGFSPKLHLDRITPAVRTLFIDADCLIAGPLEPVFDRFEGHAVSAVGERVSTGEWFGDIRRRCETFGVEAVPRFVGGVYYLEAGPMCTSVFDTAREFEERYDEVGLVRLRGMPNEEPLVSLGMAVHGQEPIPDDGTVKADAMNYTSGVELDVFRGSARFRREDDRPGPNASPAEAQPLIGHFNDAFAEQLPYTREAARLRQVLGAGWPLWAATAWALVVQVAPQAAVRSAKDLLRPVYHRLFGPRPVRPNPRLPN